MNQDASTPRQFLSVTGQPIDLDVLHEDQQRRRAKLQGELERTDRYLADAIQRAELLDPDEPRTYSAGGLRVEVDEQIRSLRARRSHLVAELAHVDEMLQETGRRIRAFDRGREALDG